MLVYICILLYKVNAKTGDIHLGILNVSTPVNIFVLVTKILSLIFRIMTSVFGSYFIGFDD